MNPHPAKGISTSKLLPKLAGCLFLSVYSSTLFAGNDNYPAGGRSSALSNASVMLSDTWNTFTNQAGLANLTSPVAALYFENRFMVKEFAMQAGTLAIPFKPGTIGLSYRFFGYSKYNEIKFGLAYGRKFNQHFSSGIQVDYLQTHPLGYENSHAIAAEIGLLAEPLKNLFVGFHLFNPTRTKQRAADKEEVPTIFRLGAGYHFEDKALLLFETEKDAEQKPVYKGGLEVNALGDLYLRGGFSSGYENYSFGLGYKFKKLTADLAFSNHVYLGFTPHVSLAYEF
jgi:hypothetical protein